MRAHLTRLVLLAALVAGGPAAAQIFGRGVAVDGDTLDIAGIAIGLFGIDAPETGQACGDAAGADWDCGAAAKARLAELIAAPDLRCDAFDRDGRDRVIALCTAGGVEINARMVADGLAWAATRYTRAFVGTEAAARAARLGVWQGASQTAWDWRAAGDWSAASGEAGPEDCAGAGAAAGARLYHLPGATLQDSIRIDPGTGQPWFCDGAAGGR